MAKRTVRTIGCLFLVVVVIAVVGIGGIAYLRQQEQLPPTPFEERCVASALGARVALSKEQATNAAIIVGVSVGRKLPSKAAAIALATAYQESGIRNLDHGDRDSLGLFQQRPSQDWGTPAEIMDPYYATNAFYDALLKVNGWESDQINDAAQRVQRSGHPEAYAQHEANAVTVATVLRGEVPDGFSCFDKTQANSDSAGLRTALQRTFVRGSNTGYQFSGTGGQLVVKAPSAEAAWAVAYHAVATSGRYGVVAIETDSRSWRVDGRTLPAWAASPVTGSQTVLSLR